MPSEIERELMRCEQSLYEMQRKYPQISLDAANMPSEIERELMRCEQSLYEMQRKYPQISLDAANARYVYDQAWANAIDDINHQAVTEGLKPPTVAVMEALATKKVADEMVAVRVAEAKLDGAKKHLDTLQAILSSVQTRSKMIQIEMSLTR